VRDGLVVGVGRVSGSGAREVDADGALVSPGWVDVHTHYDGQAVWDPQLAPSSNQGVTTVVFGNCGVGFAPVRPDQHDTLVRLMEGVEDIPGAALHEGLTWEWESFPEYLDAVERIPHDIDLAAQVPHGALRVYVMGERAVAGSDATPDDVARMADLAQEAIEAGALGFTTSRTLNHRTATGGYTPSLKASAHELQMIVAGVAEAGHGVVELISDFSPDLDGEFDLIRDMVATSGRPLSVSLAQNNHQRDGWRAILGRVEEAVAAGLPMKAQVAPRPIGLMLGLQSSFHPFSAHASYRPIAHLSLPEQVRALRDPSVRAQLLAETPKGGRRLAEFSRIFALGDPPNYEPAPETSLEAMAAARGIDPAELALDLLVEDEGRGFLFAPFSNFADFNLDACGEMMAHPDTLFGLGDGGAHVGIISDASFPTYALSHWGRDRAHGRLPVGQLVEELTSRTARAVGLWDRGEVAVGLRADLNVIDFERLSCERPVMAYDLPSGGKRLLQKARGYAATIVDGVVIAREDQPTGALPGRLVRGPRADPRQLERSA
jgi:N-acyl-D-aspartate/D-glutamate deacylase